MTTSPTRLILLTLALTIAGRADLITFSASENSPNIQQFNPTLGTLESIDFNYFFANANTTWTVPSVYPYQFGDLVTRIDVSMPGMYAAIEIWQMFVGANPCGLLAIYTNPCPAIHTLANGGFGGTLTEGKFRGLAFPQMFSGVSFTDPKLSNFIGMDVVPMLVTFSGRTQQIEGAVISQDTAWSITGQYNYTAAALPTSPVPEPIVGGPICAFLLLAIHWLKGYSYSAIGKRFRYRRNT